MINLQRYGQRQYGVEASSAVRWAIALPIVLTLTLLAGCSGDKSGPAANRIATHKVSGKVTYKGLPVENAHVSFHPRSEQGPGAFGQTNDKGEFTLRTYEDGDGAPAGEYLVSVQKFAAPPAAAKSGDEVFRQMEQQAQAGQPAESDAAPKSLLPEKYSRPQSSGLNKTVATGDANAFEFDLTD